LAVGTTPWFTARAANADEFDAILDPILNSLSSIDPTLGADVGTGTVFSFHDYCEFDLGALGCIPNVNDIADNALSYAQAQGIPAFMT